VFSEEVYLSAEHLQWLPETYFPVVMQVQRYPRYKNKRSADIYVKSYLDENHIEESPDWGLPAPNQEAAYKSLAKYAKDVLSMNEEQVLGMNKAWEWTAQHFAPYMGGARIRTAEEVIPELDKTTSSGFPFNLHYGKKSDLLKECPEIVAWVKHDFDVNMLDENYCFCWTNALKEEVRPTVKTLQNKIRTFTAGAFDGTVNGNRLFADMNEKMNDSHLQTASGVGMSPLKGNWDRLYRKLNIFTNGYALDESEYDSSLRSYMMWGCAKLRFDMLEKSEQTPENRQRIRVYYRNLVNSLIITPEGVLVMKLGGNPSGSVNTINDNTLILYCLLAYAWIMNAPGEPSYLEFEANTSKILVGDDNTWTVSDYGHRFYNARTVISTWNKIGITTTTDDLEPREAKDLDFLSAKTIFFCGKAIPVYDRAKLMTSLLYSETKQQSPAFTLLRAAALMQVGWSDTQFRAFCREFISWLLEHFDKICCDDIDWIQAKSGILTDQKLSKLFLGEEVFPQSLNPGGVESCFPWIIYQEIEKDFKKPDKRREMSTMVVQKQKKSRSRRGKGAKATRQQQPQVMVFKTLANPNAPRAPNGGRGPGRRRNRTKNRNRAGRGRNNQGGIQGAQASKGVRGMRMKGCQVIEREEILDIVGNGANFGVVQSIPINPGQSGTFPTLSKQAVIWQRYRFQSLRFEYEPTVNEFATAGTTGKVIFQVNIDAADGPPTTKAAAYATDSQLMNSDLPSRKFAISVPARYLQPVGKDWHYVRQGGLPGGADIHEYDVGNLFISTTGTVDNTTKLGELHVYYTVRFENLLNSALEAAPINNQVSVFVGTAGEALTTATPANLLFADVNPAHGFTNPLNIVNVNGTFTPPAGNYLVDVDSESANTGNGTIFKLRVLKNSLGVYNNGVNSIFQLPSGAYVSWANNQTVFVTANGTDTFNFEQTNTFSTGTSTMVESVRWTAI